MPTVNVSRAMEEGAVALWIRGVEWHLSITQVTRVAQDPLIEISLTEREDCTATVHVQGRVVLGVTAREILARTCEWLLKRGSERHGFIEIAPNPSFARVPLWPR